MTAVRDFLEEVLSRDGSFAVLSAEQCHTFREYIRGMETAALQSVCRDYECLCNRDAPLREQFEWKRNACREELQRRVSLERQGRGQSATRPVTSGRSSLDPRLKKFLHRF